tara:strand:+ start:1280 stop:1738 length:459 start_codon:yes stop_codon:yes gene_type:complete
MFDKKKDSKDISNKDNLFKKDSLSNVTAPASAKVFIGGGVNIKGEITSASEVQIDGEADVNMETENLTVGQTGNLKGDIKTKNADVWGEFDGNLEVTNTLTIQERGTVKGSTKYSALQIKLGGKLQGEVNTLESPKIKAVPDPIDKDSNKIS